jgi:hypothetical protein
MKLVNRCLLIVLILSGVACTEVMPRQRGNLALSQMAFTTDGLEFGLRQHTAFSKESAAGGYGGGGGGCGCN